MEIADLEKGANADLDRELKKLRGMDRKLAVEIDDYRKTYSGGLKGFWPIQPTDKGTSLDETAIRFDADAGSGRGTVRWNSARSRISWRLRRRSSVDRQIGSLRCVLFQMSHEL